LSSFEISSFILPRKFYLSSPLFSGGITAVTESLRLSRAAERAQLAELWPENARSLRAILASEDAQEGAKAFLERRAPQWQGR
jgi:enoyl-CoA hydratase